MRPRAADADIAQPAKPVIDEPGRCAAVAVGELDRCLHLGLVEGVAVTRIGIGIIGVGSGVVEPARAVDQIGGAVEPVLGFAVIEDAARRAADRTCGLDRGRVRAISCGGVIVSGDEEAKASEFWES